MANKRITHRVTAASEIQNGLRSDSDGRMLVVYLFEFVRLSTFENLKIPKREQEGSRLSVHGKLKLNKAPKTRFEHRASEI